MNTPAGRAAQGPRTRTEIEKDRFKEARAALDRAIRACIVEGNAAGKRKAVSEVAVDTGNLKNSIRDRMTGKLRGEIYTGVEYAVFQEYGTRYQPGKQYMRPAARAAAEAVQAALDEVPVQLIRAVLR